MKNKTGIIAEPLIVVAGCSRMGATIAFENSSRGFFTTLIDWDKTAFQKVDPDYSGFLLIGDATDQAVLEKAHIAEASQCVIATEDDSTNIYIASLVCCISKVPLIIVRLHDDKKTALLSDKRIRIIAPSLLSHQAYEEAISQKGDRS